MGSYVFTHEWDLEETRLRLLGEIFDPPTKSRLTDLGDGAMTADEIEQFRALLVDPHFCYQFPTMMAAWGRRP